MKVTYFPQVDENGNQLQADNIVKYGYPFQKGIPLEVTDEFYLNKMRGCCYFHFGDLEISENVTLIEAEKPKRKRRTKAEMEAARAEAEATIIDGEN